MTREEIINGLKFTVEMFLLNPSTGETYTEPRNDMDKITIDACRGAIEVLKQEPKIGHWYKSSCDICYTCSKCGVTNASGTKYNYCPHCGAKMTESEEKE